jgi:hypothetical protein
MQIRINVPNLIRPHDYTRSFRAACNITCYSDKCYRGPPYIVTSWEVQAARIEEKSQTTAIVKHRTAVFATFTHAVQREGGN